jgi:hypothetical protein
MKLNSINLFGTNESIMPKRQFIIFFLFFIVFAEDEINDSTFIIPLTISIITSISKETKLQSIRDWTSATIKELNIGDTIELFEFGANNFWKAKFHQQTGYIHNLDIVQTKETQAIFSRYWQVIDSLPEKRRIEKEKITVETERIPARIIIDYVNLIDANSKQKVCPRPTVCFR